MIKASVKAGIEGRVKDPAENPAAAPRDYLARADGWIAGARVKAGDTVRLTPAQAKYEPVTPVSAPAAKKGG